MKKTLRQKLIDALMDLAKDEYEDKADFIFMAKMSEEELVSELINVAEYYRDIANERD